jgi:protein arginine kinase
LAERHGRQLDDKIWRAYGLLKNARLITSAETQSLLSPIRLGLQMNRFDRFNLSTLNELFLYTQPAHLQKRAGRALTEEERAVARADYHRGRLA